MRYLSRIRLSLLARFSLVALLLTAAIAITLAWGIQQHLEQNARWQEAENASDQVTTILSPNLDSSDLAGPLSPARYAQIDALIRQNIPRKHIVRVKIWSRDGLLIYSDEKALVGTRFPISKELAEALAGKIAMEVSSLTKAENVGERERYARLLEVYIPLQPTDSAQVLGAYEIYHDVAHLELHIAAMSRFVWLSVGLGFLILYGSLFTLVRNASRELIRRNAENVRLYEEVQQQLVERKRAAEDIRRLYVALQDTNTQLRAASRAKDEMLQNVSHELRTPLVTIAGYTELLDGGALGPLLAEQWEAVKVMRFQADRLRFMVNRLLTLQTFDDKALELSDVDPEGMLRRMVDAWQARMTVTGIRFHLDLRTDLPRVLAAPDLLDQAVENLLDNAVKFSPSGALVTVRAWAEKRTDSQAERVLIAVADQGIGISPDKLERVFELFYQVGGGISRRFGGLGIGLALCRKIAEAHGGRIWAESEGEGRGSTFFVALPTHPSL